MESAQIKLGDDEITLQESDILRFLTKSQSTQEKPEKFFSLHCQESNYRLQLFIGKHELHEQESSSNIANTQVIHNAESAKKTRPQSDEKKQHVFKNAEATAQKLITNFKTSIPPKLKKRQSSFSGNESSTNSKQQDDQKEKQFLYKNKDQRKYLKNEYLKNPNFDSERIKAISKTLGLEVIKVYKWIWDKKNAEEKLYQKKINDVQKGVIASKVEKSKSKESRVGLFKVTKRSS